MHPIMKHGPKTYNFHYSTSPEGNTCVECNGPVPHFYLFALLFIDYVVFGHSVAVSASLV